MKMCENCGKKKDKKDFSWCASCVERFIDERIEYKNSIESIIANNLDMTNIGMYLT